MDKAVVLLSGGLDSTTLLHYVKKTLGVRDIYALSLIYGQKHVRGGFLTPDAGVMREEGEKRYLDA